MYSCLNQLTTLPAGRKAIDRGRMISRALPQQRGGKRRLVRRIRIMLSFETKTGALLIDLAILPRQGSVKKISGIKLDSRLGGPDLHHPPAGRIRRSRHSAQDAHTSVQHKVMIVAFA